MLAEKLCGAGVPWMLTGSAASSYYGEPRATNDLDLDYLRRQARDLGVDDLLRRELPARFAFSRTAHRSKPPTRSTPMDDVLLNKAAIMELARRRKLTAWCPFPTLRLPLRPRSTASSRS